MFSFCKGDLEITYATTSITGDPQFTFQDKNNSVTTSDITIENTAAGEMITVVLEVVHDAYTKNVSLLVPHVHLENDHESEVQSVAMFSTHLTSIAGHKAVSGQVIRYEAEEISGTASFVVS